MTSIKQFMLDHYYRHYKGKVDPVAEKFIKNENWIFPSLERIADNNENYHKVDINIAYNNEIKIWLDENVGNNHWMRLDKNYFFDDKNKALMFKMRWK